MPLTRIEKNCHKHGLTVYRLRYDGGYRCIKCRNNIHANWRSKVKKRLVDEAGGKCIRCGYNKNIKALQFHHRNPKEKEFGLSNRGMIFGIEKLRKEAAKCDLLCANCHAETHDS